MRTPFRAAALAALALALGCRDAAPVAPEPSLSPVEIQAAVRSVLITNVINNTSVQVPVKNEKEAAKVCAAAELIETIISEPLTCAIQQ